MDCHPSPISYHRRWGAFHKALSLVATVRTRYLKLKITSCMMLDISFWYLCVQGSMRQLLVWRARESRINFIWCTWICTTSSILNVVIISKLLRVRLLVIVEHKDKRGIIKLNIYGCKASYNLNWIPRKSKEWDSPLSPPSKLVLVWVALFQIGNWCTWMMRQDYLLSSIIAFLKLESSSCSETVNHTKFAETVSRFSP